MQEPHADVDATTVNNLDMRCRNCLHYAGVAEFRVNGSPALCGGKLINRAPDDTPCAAFSFDVRAFMRLPSSLRTSIMQLTKEIEAVSSINEGIAAELVVISGVMASLKLRRKGLRLGGVYEYLANNEVHRGRLLSSERTWSILEDCDSGVIYKVGTDKIQKVTRRKAVIGDTPQQQQDQE